MIWFPGDSWRDNLVFKANQRVQKWASCINQQLIFLFSEGKPVWPFYNNFEKILPWFNEPSYFGDKNLFFCFVLFLFFLKLNHLVKFKKFNLRLVTMINWDIAQLGKRDISGPPSAGTVFFTRLSTQVNDFEFSGFWKNCALHALIWMIANIEIKGRLRKT